MTRTAVIHYLLSDGWFGISPHVASSHLFSIWYKKKKGSALTFHVPPAPLIHVQPFETSKDSCETNRASQTPPSFIVRWVLYNFSFFSTVFSYCRHLDRWGTPVLHWRSLRLDSAARPRWSNRPFVWFLHKVCGCLHHLYVTADVLLLEKICRFHMMQPQRLAQKGRQSPLCFYQCAIT